MPVLKLLLVEDNPGDARLIQEMIGQRGGGQFHLQTCTDLQGARQILAGNGVQLVLMDLGLPDSVGLDSYENLRAVAPRVPIIVLSGTNDQDLAVKAVAQGAQDYLVKGQVDRDLLVRAIRYAVEREQARQKIQALNAELEQRVAERTRELAQVNQALERANSDLRQLDRMKSSFIRVTSHELNTPMQVVIGMLAVQEEEMRRHPEASEDQRRVMVSAFRGANRLKRLVERVLKIAMVGEYRVRLERTPTPPADLVQEVVEVVTPYVALRYQTLQVQVPADLPPHAMDREKIHDVLLNLLTNAIKFTPDGGTITVRAARDELGALTFWVSDTGMGIPEPERSHIFDEFFVSFDTRHHSSGEYEFGKRGIGLGLSIARSFVDMHGGLIWLEEQPGPGSTFCFTLPPA